MSDFAVRSLSGEDWEVYKNFRIEALQGPEKGVFQPQAGEESWDANKWRQFCAETETQSIVGLFHKSELVGATTIEPWSGDTTGEAALIGSTYVRPAHRHKRTDLLYQYITAYIHNHPKFNSAIFYIREDNEAVIKLYEKRGAQYICTTSLDEFSDGTRARSRMYQYKGVYRFPR